MDNSATPEGQSGNAPTIHDQVKIDDLVREISKEIRQHINQIEVEGGLCPTRLVKFELVNSKVEVDQSEQMNPENFVYLASLAKLLFMNSATLLFVQQGLTNTTDPILPMLGESKGAYDEAIIDDLAKCIVSGDSDRYLDYIAEQAKTDPVLMVMLGIREVDDGLQQIGDHVVDIDAVRNYLRSTTKYTISYQQLCDFTLGDSSNYTPLVLISNFGEGFRDQTQRDHDRLLSKLKGITSNQDAESQLKTSLIESITQTGSSLFIRGSSKAITCSIHNWASPYDMLLLASSIFNNEGLDVSELSPDTQEKYRFMLHILSASASKVLVPAIQMAGYLPDTIVREKVGYYTDSADGQNYQIIRAKVEEALKDATHVQNAQAMVSFTGSVLRITTGDVSVDILWHLTTAAYLSNSGDQFVESYHTKLMDLVGPIIKEQIARLALNRS